MSWRTAIGIPLLISVIVSSAGSARADVKSAFDIPYTPAKVAASVKPYVVKSDLSNVTNRAKFAKLSPARKALLVKNGFVAAPTDNQQLFFIYEENDYKGVPSFVTTDSVLQTYHIFYDFTLRTVEKEKLYPIVKELTSSMVSESAAVSHQMTSPEWKRAAELNEVYFAVPSQILGQKVALPSPVQNKMLESEIASVMKAGGKSGSAIFDSDIDYSQFIPRGHYTRTDLFKRYFRAMMWYGYMPFYATYAGDKPDWQRIQQALLITKMLYTTKIGEKSAIDAWRRIYEPTAFYVGSSDDITPEQYKPIMDKVYGPDVTYAELQDKGKLQQVFDMLTKLQRPKIGPTDDLAFKFMGQRYIADSEMLQRLTHYPERLFPRGLDVPAVLGSSEAAGILDNQYKEPQNWDQYLPRRTALRKEFAIVPELTWRSNLYWGWLWGLDSLTGTYGNGYPSFMRNKAWQDKNLNTFLGSWAELRHDTILYGKQSSAECGGGDQPIQTKGYVEPNVEFYGRLLWLTKASKTGLQARGLITPEVSEKFDEFGDLLHFLENVSVKELTNQKVTKDEYEQIRIFGADLERLTLSVIDGAPTDWELITNETDRDMAVIADVHTGGDSVLEEAVGHASEIYVVVPIEGQLCITRGAIFSYYEFEHPSDDRLTDEKWQKMIKEQKAPPSPDWTKSFMPGGKPEKPLNKTSYSSGC